MKYRQVRLTKSGLLIRADSSMGILVFSPYTGVVFACRPKDQKALTEWLDMRTTTAPTADYEKALGPGWAIAVEAADYPQTNLLPSAEAYQMIPYPTYPIVINWLLTGSCALRCQYCYAEDLMRGKRKEPTKSELLKISKTILSYNPLAVVLTGGDPLLSNHLEAVLETLHGKTGLMIDTSGFSFNETHLALFKKYGVFVRISLDSEIPRINDMLRPIDITTSTKRKLSSSSTAMRAICSCIDAGLGVGIQTVATSQNRSDLEAFGDKLYRLGARSWRILMVAPSATNVQQYNKLKGSQESLKRFEQYIKKHLRVKHENGWNKGMSVQLTHNRAPNSVILVTPDGVFETENKVNTGKLVIDENSPTRPDIQELFRKVDAHAHAERYLNL